jgi:capsule polysaccharide export protein KpsE/RkpR
MKQVLGVLGLLIVLVGCSKPLELGAPSINSATSNTKPSTNQVNRYLAYQHVIRIDTEDHKIRALFDTAQAICLKDQANLCTILESSLHAGSASSSSSASLKLRAKPDGVQKLIAALSQRAELTSRSTSAEDLASPIQDTEKKLAMLHDYRNKLEALRSRASNDMDALIKLNHELAQVQSELEQSAGTHAHLMQRVETEILNVSITAIQSRPFWRPITTAVSEFGPNLSQGVSTAIVGIAYLTPWFILIMCLVWGIAKWRRRWKKHSLS